MTLKSKIMKGIIRTLDVDLFLYHLNENSQLNKELTDIAIIIM